MPARAITAARRLGCVVAALSGAGSASAAVPGVPEPPRPGPFPALVLSVGNDAFGGEVGDNADDFRTNEASAQALLARRWLVVVDHSILTNKARDEAPAGRSDEITATVGYLAEPFVAPDRANRLWLSVGAGARAAGDFGGERAQNALHGALGYRQLHLPYGGRSVDGVVDGTLGWLWLEHLPVAAPTFPFLARGQIGLQTIVAGLASGGGERQAEVGVALTLVGVDGAAWAGPRYRWDLGDPATPAATAVARREEGWWIAYGASAGAWFVSGAINVEDHETLGTVGWIGGRGPGRVGGAEPAVVEADLLFAGGFTPGVEGRWQPAWLRDAGWLGERSALLLDYRFGSVGGVDWGPDEILSFQQAVIGIEVASARPRPGWQLAPFLRVALGERSEFARVRGPSPRFAADATRVVALGGVGARLTWGPRLGPQRTVRYGLAAFVDGWLPFGDAHATAADGGGATYQRMDWAPGGALTTVVAW